MFCGWRRNDLVSLQTSWFQDVCSRVATEFVRNFVIVQRLWINRMLIQSQIRKLIVENANEGVSAVFGSLMEVARFVIGKPDYFEMSCSKLPGSTTEGSHSSEPFFTQVNHLISSNRFSKQVMNPADFPTLKIWDQSDHWLRSYGWKVNIFLTKS